jgi:hypothetical protein
VPLVTTSRSPVPLPTVPPPVPPYLSFSPTAHPFNPPTPATSIFHSCRLLPACVTCFPASPLARCYPSDSYATMAAPPCSPKLIYRSTSKATCSYTASAKAPSATGCAVFLPQLTPTMGPPHQPPSAPTMRPTLSHLRRPAPSFHLPLCRLPLPPLPVPPTVPTQQPTSLPTKHPTSFPT